MSDVESAIAVIVGILLGIFILLVFFLLRLDTIIKLLGS